jgi:prepilin-type N-terminal cleavage/methylation domain-containing protein
MNNEKGATLIELLAVIAVISIVIGLIASAQFAWFKGTNDLQKQTLHQEKVRFAAEQLVRDIESASSLAKQDGAIAVGQPMVTEVVEIELKNGSDSRYLFNRNTGDFMLERGSVNVVLAVNVDNFYLDPTDGTKYIIDFILKDVDPRTGQKYRILTIARPINWG